MQHHSRAAVLVSVALLRQKCKAPAQCRLGLSKQLSNLHAWPASQPGCAEHSKRSSIRPGAGSTARSSQPEHSLTICCAPCVPLLAVCKGKPTAAPADGSYTWEGCSNLRAGFICTAKCADGFVAIPEPPKARCTATGSWHIFGGQCKKGASHADHCSTACIRASHRVVVCCVISTVLQLSCTEGSQLCPSSCKCGCR